MLGVILASRDAESVLSLALRSRDGEPSPTVVLLDGAVAAARSSHPAAGAIRDAVAAGIVVLVHDEAALRRGIAAEHLTDGVKTVDLDEVADLIADASGRVIWL